MRLDRQYICTQLMAQYITKKFRLIKAGVHLQRCWERHIAGLRHGPLRRESISSTQLLKNQCSGEQRDFQQSVAISK